MELEEAKLSAKRNFDRLVSDIPKHLSDREDGFFNQIEKAKTSPKKKLESLYSFMNELYQFASHFTPCKKGCNSCCYYTVTVSEIEIAYIEKHANKKRAKPFGPKRDYHGTPCPFLVNGGCSIYESRPFVCRRHIALTANSHWCDPVRSNDETFSLLEFSNINKAYDFIRRESGSYETYDIRQVFLCEAK